MSEVLARSQLYVLDEHNNPVRADNLQEWAQHMEQPHQIGNDVVRGVRISTVFMGLAGNLLNLPRPFETLLFMDGVPLPESQRYATWDAAKRGHAQWVERVKKQGVMAHA